MAKPTFSALIIFVFALVPCRQAFASHEAHDTAVLNDDPDLWPQVPRIRPVPSRAFLRARDATGGCSDSDMAFCPTLVEDDNTMTSDGATITTELGSTVTMASGGTATSTYTHTMTGSGETASTHHGATDTMTSHGTTATTDYGSTNTMRSTSGMQSSHGSMMTGGSNGASTAEAQTTHSHSGSETSTAPSHSATHSKASSDRTGSGISVAAVVGLMVIVSTLL